MFILIVNEVGVLHNHAHCILYKRKTMIEDGKKWFCFAILYILHVTKNMKKKKRKQKCNSPILSTKRRDLKLYSLSEFQFLPRGPTV